MTDKKDKKEETKDLTLELKGTGDKIIFRDFEADPPMTKDIRIMMDIDGIFQGKNKLQLLPLLVKQGITKKGQLFKVDIDYMDRLAPSDGISIIQRVNEMYNFLVSSLQSDESSIKKESKED